MLGLKEVLGNGVKQPPLPEGLTYSLEIELLEQGKSLDTVFDTHDSGHKRLLNPVIGSFLAGTVALTPTFVNAIEISQLQPDRRYNDSSFMYSPENFATQSIEDEPTTDRAHAITDAIVMDDSFGGKLAAQSLDVVGQFVDNTEKGTGGVTVNDNLAQVGVLVALKGTLPPGDKLIAQLEAAPSNLVDILKTDQRFHLYERGELSPEQIRAIHAGAILDWTLTKGAEGKIAVLQPHILGLDSRFVTSNKLNTLGEMEEQFGSPRVFVPVNQQESEDAEVPKDSDTENPLSKNRPDSSIIEAAEHRAPAAPTINLPEATPTTLPAALTPTTEPSATQTASPTATLTPQATPSPQATPITTAVPTAAATVSPVATPDTTPSVLPATDTPESSQTDEVKLAPLADNEIYPVKRGNNQVLVYTQNGGWRETSGLVKEMAKHMQGASDMKEGKLPMTDINLALVAEKYDEIAVPEIAIRVSQGIRYLPTRDGELSESELRRRMEISKGTRALQLKGKTASDVNLRWLAFEYNQADPTKNKTIIGPLKRRYITPKGIMTLEEMIYDLGDPQGANNPDAFGIALEILNGGPIKSSQDRIDSVIKKYFAITFKDKGAHDHVPGPIVIPSPKPPVPTASPIAQPSPKPGEQPAPTTSPHPTEQPAPLPQPSSQFKEWPKNSKGYSVPFILTRIIMHGPADYAQYDGNIGLYRAVIPDLLNMGVSGFKVLANRLDAIGTTELLTSYGIMPVVRIYKEKPNPAGLSMDDIKVIPAYIARGARYMEFSNEDNLTDEWRTGWQKYWTVSDKDPDRDRKWKIASKEAVAVLAPIQNKIIVQIQRMRAYPVLPALSPGGNIDDIYFYQARSDWYANPDNKCELADYTVGPCIELYRFKHSNGFPLVVGVHNYPLNHPIDYMKDSNGYLKPRWYRVIDMKNGIDTMYLATEGGPAEGDSRDSSFPKIDINIHRRMLIESARHALNLQNDPFVLFDLNLWNMSPNNNGFHAFDNDAYFLRNGQRRLGQSIQGLIDLHSGKIK